MSVFLYKYTSKNVISKIKTQASEVNNLIATAGWYPSKAKAMEASAKTEVKSETKPEVKSKAKSDTK